MRGAWVAVSCLISIVQRSVQDSDDHLIETAAPISPYWRLEARSPATTNIELLIAVKQRRTEELERALLTGADPDSRLYGQHLGSNAVHALVAPEKTHVSAVLHWLRQHDVYGELLSPNGDWIQAKHNPTISITLTGPAPAQP